MTDFVKGNKDYVIEAVRWFLDQEIVVVTEFGSRIETHRTLEDVRPRYWQIVSFLQSNNLTTHTLARKPEDIDETFEIRVSDLTQEGHDFIKTGYQRWLAALDRGTSPEKITILEKWLKKLRAEEAKPKIPCDESCLPLHKKK